MNNNYYIHPSYKRAEILEFVQYLVACNCPDGFDDVSLSDKYKLATLLSIVDGHTDELSFLIESNDSREIMCLFRRYATSPNSKNSSAFLQALKEAFVGHYTPTMEKLFNVTSEDRNADIEANIDHTRKYGDEDAAYDNYISNNL